MKKFFFYAAAIVALASCSKTQVVYNDAPQEIGFKAVTGAITKAESEEPTTLSGNIDMGVFAFVNSGKALYFENIKFTANNNVWTGGQYWPLQSSLDFVVYAPHGTASYTNNTLTVSNVNNTGKTTIATQTDCLYGAEYFDDEDGNGYLKEQVSTNLKHALAKVTLNFSGSNVTVNSVYLEKPTLQGSYTVNYGASAPAGPVADWGTPTAETTNLQLTEISGAELALAVEDNPETNDVNEAAVAKTASVSIMVVPAAVSDILIEYKIKGTDDILDAEIPLTGTWASGTHYIYNITISPNAIEFTAPTIADWADGEGSDPTIQ